MSICALFGVVIPPLLKTNTLISPTLTSKPYSCSFEHSCSHKYDHHGDSLSTSINTPVGAKLLVSRRGQPSYLILPTEPLEYGRYTIRPALLLCMYVCMYVCGSKHAMVYQLYMYMYVCMYVGRSLLRCTNFTCTCMYVCMYVHV